MNVNLLTITPITNIVSGIRKCWKSDELSDSDYHYDILGQKDAQLIKRIIKHGHTSTLEHSLITFDVDGISRACFDEKTEILTESKGFVKFSELTESDNVATLNKEFNIEYQCPTDHIQYYYEGKMIKGANTKFDFLVTPDHRMFASMGYGTGSRKSSIKDRDYEFVNAEDLVGKTGKFYRTSQYVGIKQEKFFIEGAEYSRGKVSGFKTKDVECKTNNFLEFLGRYIADGHIHLHSGHYRISLTDSEDKEEELQQLIKNIGFTSYVCKNKSSKAITVSFNNKTLYEWLEENVGKGAVNKKIPTSILKLDKSHLEFLYKGLIDGDGYKRKKFPDTYYTSSKLLADNMQELSIKLGKSSVLYESIRDTNFKKGSHSYQVTIASERFNTPRFNSNRNASHDINEEHYQGNVYCVTVPNSTILVRRNGKIMWAGNCLQELSRHRIGVSPSVESTRYTIKKILNDDCDIESVLVKSGCDALDELNRKHMTELITLIDEYNLPNDISKYGIVEAYKVSEQISFNFRSFREFYELRSSKKALPEIRALANCMMRCIPDKYNILIEDIINEKNDY